MIETILNKMDEVSKPQKKFLVKIFAGLFCLYGRFTMRNLSRYALVSERTISRQFEKDFNFAQFNSLAHAAYLPEKAEYAISFDAFFISKSGKKTYGIDDVWNGSESRSEKGLEGFGLAIIDIKNNQAYPLYVEQTPPMTDLKKMLGEETTRMDFYLEVFKKTRSYIPQNVKYAMGDAAFAKERIVNAICYEGYHVISKLRKDRTSAKQIQYFDLDMILI